MNNEEHEHDEQCMCHHKNQDVIAELRNKVSNIIKEYSSQLIVPSIAMVLMCEAASLISSAAPSKQEALECFDGLAAMYYEAIEDEF